MTVVRLTFISIAALLVTACSTAPRQQALIPQNLGSATFAVFHTEVLDKTSNVTKHLDDEKDILYHQEFGGGGAGLGILLGPIGVAANGLMIEANTQKDVDQLLNKISIKPRDLFLVAAKRQGVEAVNGKLLITPYVYISKTDGEILLIASAVIIEQRADEEKWTGKYMYQLPVTFTVDSLARLDPEATETLRIAIANGFSKLLATVAKENREHLGTEKSVTFKSNFMSPRFDITMAGQVIDADSDVTWVRTRGGVYALTRDSFSVIP